MGEVKKVVVVCGTGIATSTVIADKIYEECKKEGIKLNVVQCKVTEMNAYISNADLIVSTTIMSQKTNVPVVKGLPFLTGVGVEGVLEEIINILKK